MAAKRRIRRSLLGRSLLGLSMILGACRAGPSQPTPEGDEASATELVPRPGEGTDDPSASADAPADAPLDPGPPVTLTHVRQYTIGPAEQWRFDPRGELVAWTNEGRCGLWRYESGAFLGYFDHSETGPCATWLSSHSRFVEREAAGPAETPGAGMTASVERDRVRVRGSDGSVTLELSCPKCRAYEAVAWSGDGTQLAVARSQPWGVDLWSIADQKLIDQVDIDARGKEQDIGVLWGRKGLYAFVSHAYDPNEGKGDIGMEEYTHVHGPALSSFRLDLGNGASKGGPALTNGKEIRDVSSSLARIIVDPHLGAAWVHVKSHDPREFGHSYWDAIALGASPQLGSVKPHDPQAFLRSTQSYHWGATWAERPYEIFAAVEQSTRTIDGTPTKVYEVLGVGVRGGPNDAGWMQQQRVWSRPVSDAMVIHDAKIDAVGFGWSELRGRACPEGGPSDPSKCEAVGPTHACEPVDFAPSGQRMIAWCPPTVALLERDGTKVVELIDLPPDELRWRWVDQDTLALLGNDRNLLLISISEAKVRETIPDVRQIYPLAAGADFDLFAYRTGAGFHLRSVDGKRRFERSESVFAAAIDPTGEHVAVTDQKTIDIYAIASGERLVRWRASKQRKLAYRQDGQVLFGTQVRERGPTRAWDPRTGEERNEAVPDSSLAASLADDPSWRWAWRGDRLRRAVDGRALIFEAGSAMLDNGLYEGEPPDALGDIVLRRGETLEDFVIYDARVLAPALRREGLVSAFLAGEPLPEVVVGAHELERLLAAADAK